MESQIADHNSGAWIDDVKHAAAAKGLVVFPGVEITCMGGTEGIHIIALFDPSCGRADIESLLGNPGLKPSEYGVPEFAPPTQPPSDRPDAQRVV